MIVAHNVGNREALSVNSFFNNGNGLHLRPLPVSTQPKSPEVNRKELKKA